MVRNYKKKNTHPEVNEEDVEKAIKLVLKEQMSCRQAADICGLKHTTLFYRLQKLKEKHHTTDEQVGGQLPCFADLPDSTVSLKYGSKFTCNQVFSKEQEILLKDHILKCSALNYGLTYKRIRVLAYEYAKHLGQCPEKWQENKEAGIDWLKSYMKRHPTLSLRKPENTSLARVLGFNKTSVDEFQKNLSEVYDKHKFSPENIINLDETGILTVVQAPHVVALKGSKQVGQVVSGERGSLVTLCAIITASGNTIPPVFVFPRARMHDSLLSGSVPGSLGLTNSPTSGWMTGELFLKVLEHVVKHTRCSKELPILIIMDNHESHCNLDVILFAQDNGIVIVTIPPHSSHRLQPLDVSVFGPFKKQVAVIQNDWLLNNPGKKISIHNLAAFASKAFDLTFTRHNIMKGFQECGIWPYSSTIFSDQDFLAVMRPTGNNDSPDNVTQYHGNYTEDTETTKNASDRPTEFAGPSQKKSPCLDSTDGRKSTAKSPGPDVVRPIPEPSRPLGNRLNYKISAKKGKQKGKSRIWTKTPEKNRLEEENALKLEKKLMKEGKAKRKLELSFESQKIKGSKKMCVKKVGRKRFKVQDSESELSDEVVYNESEDSPYCESFGSSEDDNFEPKSDIKINPMLEKYYAVYYDLTWYLGRVIDFHDEGLTKIKFLKEGLGERYGWPEHDDVQVIENKYIFYGPVRIEGNGPFYIGDTCKRRINMKYKLLKSQ